MKFYILDERDVWHAALAQAALEIGLDPVRVRRGANLHGSKGLGFIRPHATPAVLHRNKNEDAPIMFERLTMIQDAQQVRLYEDKTAQLALFGEWMPDTTVETDRAVARGLAEVSGLLPLVSKANEGASSVNVRIIRSRDELLAHIDQAFGPGIPVRYCDSRGTTGLQKGYVYLQEFIPHDITYRVNIIGSGRAIFKRYCYPDKPVAQTGNVDAVHELDPLMESLLEYADRFAAFAGTKWCALDILRHGDEWKLLETSLAWPWPPTRADLASAPIFRTKYQWGDLFKCLMTEVLRGAF